MERTISGMMGKGSVNHNTRTFTAKNVDKERSKYNLEFCNYDIKQVYHKLFDEALERYNAKQKRNDRKIDNYYEKIRQGKQEKLFYEVIFQIGNKDDMNAKTDYGKLAKKILCEFMEQFQNRNSNLYVFSAHLHMDEETPHLHIDFVPFICNSRRGLDTRVSLKGALGEQGFKGGARGATEWNQWIESEKQELSKIMERYGVKWKQLGTHNKHLSVLDFEKREREKEVAVLEKEIASGHKELEDVIFKQEKAEENIKQIIYKGEAIQQTNNKLSEENIFLKAQNDNLEDEKKKLQDNNQRLGKEQEKLQIQLEKMVNSKKVMERNVRAYDEEPQWQLPEAGTFMSAKSYRNKTEPLIIRFKEVAKNLTVKCVNLMEQDRYLTDKVKSQEENIKFMKGKIKQQEEKIKQLQEKADDLEFVRQYIGRDKIDMIILNEIKSEDIKKSMKQHNRSI